MADIKFISMDDELDFFVEDDWPVVVRHFKNKYEKRQSVRWIENYASGRVVIYNGAVRPEPGSTRWPKQILSDGVTYYFFFEDKDVATMFKVAN